MFNIFSFFGNNDDPTNEALKPSSEIIDGRITYKFKNGLIAYQEELNLDQDEKLTELLLGFNLDSFSIDKTNIKDLIDMVIKEKALSRLLGIILIPEKGIQACMEEDYSGLKNSELGSVFMDFFSLNPTVISWLKSIGEGLTSLPKIQSTKSSLNQ